MTGIWMSFHWTLSIKNKPQLFLKSSQVLATCWLLCLDHSGEWLSRLPAPLTASGSIAGACSVWLQTPLCICFVYWGEGFLYIYFGRGSGWDGENTQISLSQNNVCKSPPKYFVCECAGVSARMGASDIFFPLCSADLWVLLFFFLPPQKQLLQNKIVNKSYIIFVLTMNIVSQQTLNNRLEGRGGDSR